MNAILAGLNFKRVALGLTVITTGTIIAIEVTTGPRVKSALSSLGNLNYTDLVNRSLEEITMPKITDRVLHALHPGGIASNVTKAASEGKWPELDILLPENLLMAASIIHHTSNYFCHGMAFYSSVSNRR